MQKKQNIRLKDLEKRQLYTVPENYFENLPATIRRRINAAPAGKTTSFSWFRYSIRIAGVFLVLLAGYIWYANTEQQDPYQLILAASQTEIVDYLQVQELSQYDIIDAASNADVIIEDQFFQQTDINSELLLDEADEKIILEYM